MDYPTPDGVWCRRCGHGYWQYPDREPSCPQCKARSEEQRAKIIHELQEENKALREAIGKCK